MSCFSPNASSSALPLDGFVWDEGPSCPRERASGATDHGGRPSLQCRVNSALLVLE